MTRATPPDSALVKINQSLFDSPRQPTPSAAIEKPSHLTSASIVRQEANLLRFPFFALGRRGLRNHKGLLIRGHSKLDNQSYDFEYCITCNTNDIYPGQLARKVHMGLLRIMQSKQAFPFANPIEFTWRELMETIGVAAGGANLQSIKQAIRSIKDQDFVEFVNDYQVELLEDFLARAKAAGSRVWWFDHCLDSYKRLRSAHIDDNHELRAALRELTPHLAHAAGDDPVTKAEDELRGKELPGFFPTPRRVIEQMLDLAGIEQTHRVLEPSCGKGDILDGIRNEHPDIDLTAVEQNLTLQGVLTAKGYSDIVSYEDFLEHGGEYDRVLMNPPFEHGQDTDHVRHAYGLLASGGRLVSVVCEGPFFRSDQKSVAFREWLDELAADIEQLPDDAFQGVDAFRQTGVKTRLVTIDKA